MTGLMPAAVEGPFAASAWPLLGLPAELPARKREQYVMKAKASLPRNCDWDRLVCRCEFPILEKVGVCGYGMRLAIRHG